MKRSRLIMLKSRQRQSASPHNFQTSSETNPREMRYQDDSVTQTSLPQKPATPLLWMLVLALPFSVCAVSGVELAAEELPAEGLASSYQPSDSDQIDYHWQRVINQTLLRQPETAALLQHFEQCVEQGRWIEAAKLFQMAVEQSQDSFFWHESEIRPLHQHMHLLFLKSPELWRVYSQLFEPVAKQNYSPDSLISARETVRKYFFTPTGLQAAIQLAGIAWDHGEFHEAARLWTLILSSSFPREQLNLQQFKQIQLVAELAGDSHLQRLVAKRSGSSNGADHRRHLWEQFQQQQISSGKFNPRLRQQDLIARQTPPLLQAAWSVPRQIFSENSGQVNQEVIKLGLQNWSASQQEQLRPEFTALSAVVTGDQLIYRNWDEIISVDLSQLAQSSDAESHKTRLWQFPSQSLLTDSVTYEQDPLTGTTLNQPAVERFLLANSLSSSLTTDGRRVYLVDSIKRSPLASEPQTASLETNREPVQKSPVLEETVAPLAHQLSNRLVALTLPSSRTAGETSSPVVAWKIDQSGWENVVSAQRNSSAHPLQGSFFLGPPTVSGQVAYVMSERFQHVYLSALNSTSGELIWQQAISYTDRPIERDTTRATRICLPVVSQGMILCDNGNGQFVGLDKVLGTLLWTYSYADEDPRQLSGRWNYTQALRQSQAGAQSLPVITAGRILLLPERSRFIHCCDLKTGRLLWKKPREKTEYLANLQIVPETVTLEDEAKLFLAVEGRRCRAISAETGELVWETQTGLTSGSGIQVGEYFLLPTTSEQVVCQHAGDLPEIDKGSCSFTTPETDRIVAIHVKTGRLHGLGWPTSATSVCSSTQRSWQAGEGVDFAPSPLGNLLSSQDMIIAVGVQGLVGFQQSGHLKQELEKLALTPDQLTEAQLQQYAEAEWWLENTAESKQLLKTALRLPATEADLRQKTREQYRELLYHELRAARSDQPEVAVSLLREIDELADTPDQKARSLTAKIEQLAFQKSYREMLHCLDEFVGLGRQIPVSHPSGSNYISTSASWLPGSYAQVFRNLSEADQSNFLNQFEQRWISRIDQIDSAQLFVLLQALSPGRMFTLEERAFSHFRGDVLNSSAHSGREAASLPEIDRLHDLVCLKLIEREFAAENWQRAELLLIRLQGSGNVESQAFAFQGLAELYSQLELHLQAGRALESLAKTDFRNQAQENQLELNRVFLSRSESSFHSSAIQTISLETSSFDNRFKFSEGQFSQWDENHPSWQAFQDRIQGLHPVQRASIQQLESAVPLKDDPYARKRILYSPTNQQWLVMQQTDLQAPENVSSPQPAETIGKKNMVMEQHLVIQDRSSGVERHRLAFPGSRITLSNTARKQVGHLLPVVVQNRLLALSLLDGKPVWERNVSQLELMGAEQGRSWEKDRSGVFRPVSAEQQAQETSLRRVELGPVGPGYCLVQTSRALTCYDPLDGRLLWKRADLDPQGGLWTDRTNGLFGDEQVLVYFHPDQSTYTVLKTESGQILSQGRLEESFYQVQRTRQVFGRHLMYLAISKSDPQDRRLRLWDPLDRSLQIDEVYGSRDFYHASETELTILLSAGKLIIFCPEKKQKVVDLSLREEFRGQANYLRVARHRDRYLVNFYQTQRGSDEQGYYTRYSDTPWNLTHISGPVLCINSGTGQLEWSRNFASRTLVNDETGELPLLVMLANHQQKPGDQQRTLVAEMINLKTGETLGQEHDFPVERLLIQRHDRERSEIRLIGLNREIVVAYEKEEADDL